MIGSIAIDFRPDDSVVPRILETIEIEGFALRGLRLIPCPNHERSTLQMDLEADRRGADLNRLEHQLRSVEEIFSVIHHALAPNPAGVR